MQPAKYLVRTEFGYKEKHIFGNHDVFLWNDNGNPVLTLAYEELTYNSYNKMISINRFNRISRNKHPYISEIDVKIMWDNSGSLTNMCHDFPELHQQLEYIRNVLIKKHRAIGGISIDPETIKYSQFVNLCTGKNIIKSIKGITRFSPDTKLISFCNYRNQLLVNNDNIIKRIIEGNYVHDHDSDVISILNAIDNEVIKIINRPESMQLPKPAV